MQKRGLTHLLAIAVMASCLRPGPLWSQPVPEQEQRLSPSPSEQPTGCFGAVIEKIESLPQKFQHVAVFDVEFA